MNLDDEDFNLAVALSLSEPDAYQRHPTPQEKADEELAKSLQEQFNKELPSNLHPNSLTSPSSTQSVGVPMPSSSTSTPPEHASCAGCKQALIQKQNRPATSLLHFLAPPSPTTTRYLQALGHYWHPYCFKCTSCQKPLQSTRFTIDENQKPYHQHCHQQQFHPRCYVCSNFLPKDEETSKITWHVTPFWNDKTCPIHSSDGTARCTACTRYKPATDDDWHLLSDGRHICPRCRPTSIPDTESCAPLYKNIIDFYSKMGMPLPVQPPLMLVDNAALNQAVSNEATSTGQDRSDGPVFHTRGLCLTEYSHVVQTVVHNKSFLGAISREERVHVGPTQCHITAVLVLYGLPYLLTGCILAHECMHGWLRMSGYTTLPLQVEEGLCQLMALLWLEGKTHVPGEYEERMAAFLGNQLRTDPSAVYGDGLRNALDAFQRLGLPTVLAHVKRAGRLP